MTDPALPEDSGTHEERGLDGERADGADEETRGAAGPTPTTWALRGALFGAVAGSVTGAGFGMLFATRPAVLAQVRSAIGGNGRHVARAAAVAAGEVMTSRHLNQLLTGDGERDRGDLLKQAAREAGAAAATAARDEIISLKSDAAGSKLRGVVEGGRNGARS